MNKIILLLFLITFNIIKEKNQVESRSIDDMDFDKDCLINEINNRVNKYCIVELRKKASCRKTEGHTNFCLNLSKDEAERCGVKYKIKITEFLKSINWKGPKYNDDFEPIKCKEIINIIYNDFNNTVYEINYNLDKSLNSTLEYFDQCMNKNVPNIILLNNNNETHFGNFYST